RLRLVASTDGADGSVRIHQDARVYATVLDGADEIVHTLADGRRAYLHVARGSVELNGQRLSAGDGARIERERELRLGRAQQAEVLLFTMDETRFSRTIRRQGDHERVSSRREVAPRLVRHRQDRRRVPPDRCAIPRARHHGWLDALSRRAGPLSPVRVARL